MPWTHIRTCMNILDIKLELFFNAVQLLQQCCLSNISTIMDYRHLINAMDTYKDMYKHFRHQTGTLLQCCSVAAAVLFDFENFWVCLDFENIWVSLDCFWIPVHDSFLSMVVYCPGRRHIVLQTIFFQLSFHVELILWT